MRSGGVDPPSETTEEGTDGPPPNRYAQDPRGPTTEPRRGADPSPGRRRGRAAVHDGGRLPDARPRGWRGLAAAGVGRRRAGSPAVPVAARSDGGTAATGLRRGARRAAAQGRDAG